MGAWWVDGWVGLGGWVGDDGHSVSWQDWAGGNTSRREKLRLEQPVLQCVTTSSSPARPTESCGFRRHTCLSGGVAHTQHTADAVTVPGTQPHRHAAFRSVPAPTLHSSGPGLHCCCAPPAGAGQPGCVGSTLCGPAGRRRQCLPVPCCWPIQQGPDDQECGAVQVRVW